MDKHERGIIDSPELVEPRDISIDTSAYVYKKAERVLSVAPEEDEVYAKAVADIYANTAAKRANALVPEEHTEKFWRNAYENLPDILAGYVRVMHHTYTLELAESIRQNGLRYENRIERTACIVRDMNEKNEKGNRILYNTRVEQQKDGVVVVFDLPEEGYKKYKFNRGNNGIIPAQYFVAALPEREPVIWIDKAGTFVPLSERFNPKP